MKAAQDWSFISKDQGLPKVKPQDNRIFHALTAAYTTGQSQEIFGASASIVQREKEMCEMALAELQKVHNGSSQPDPTLGLIRDHYQSRLRIASEKESKLSKLADDSRKLNEDHKKKNQELADVKRHLMESQSKLRELAKQTEKLIKKEEELRFIEDGLRKELDNNKREMLNGLYEIVVELGVQTPPALPAAEVASEDSRSDLGPENQEHADVLAERLRESEENRAADLAFAKATADAIDEGTLSPPERIPKPAIPSPHAMPKAMDEAADNPSPATVKIPTGQGLPASANGQATIVLASAPTVNTGTLTPAPFAQPKGTSLEALTERAQRAKAFEPLKALFSRSLVKTSEGEAICEYFYPVTSAKENRKYVINALFTVHALLQVLQRDPTGFHSRLEMAAGDLLSRLDHGNSIALEEALKGDFTREVLNKMLSLAWKPREQAFQELALRVISRLESLGAMRSKSLEDQFARWPK